MTDRAASETAAQASHGEDTATEDLDGPIQNTHHELSGRNAEQPIEIRDSIEDSVTWQRTQTTRSRTRTHDWAQPETVATATDYGRHSLFHHTDRNCIETTLPPERLSHENLRYYHGYIQEQMYVWKYVTKLSSEEATKCIQDTPTLPFLRRLFPQKLDICRMLLLVSSSEFTASTHTFKIYGESYTKSEYVEKCVKESEWTHSSLKHACGVALELQGYLTEAVARGFLNETSLVILKRKISALQEYFHQACNMLNKPRADLLWDTERWWIPNDDFVDRHPKNFTDAYQKIPTSISTLTFIVPVLSLMSCIPAVLTWTYSAHHVGSPTEADFYQLVSSSSMQLLSILVLIIPTVSNVRLVKMAWFWTWMLAGAGTLCAIIAIPLYLLVPTEWVAMISFVASVTQGLVILQLTFTL